MDKLFDNVWASVAAPCWSSAIYVIFWCNTTKKLQFFTIIADNLIKIV